MSPIFALACAWLCSPPPAPAVQQDTPSPRYGLLVAEESALELRALWEACRTSTYGLFASTPALRSAAPARARESFGGELFRPFLPAAPVALGEVWRVESSAVLVFLRQFHAGAVLEGHFNGGEVPGTLPITTPQRVGFALNLRTAEHLGLNVAPDVAADAAETMR